MTLNPSVTYHPQFFKTNVGYERQRAMMSSFHLAFSREHEVSILFKSNLFKSSEVNGYNRDKDKFKIYFKNIYFDSFSKSSLFYDRIPLVHMQF